ncbi:hypothetical protein CYMTET_42932 [Cymbomonas tetramitiformis]|uniref:Uncharacterized protein n=1 Tax=Cymbomonas tetramitiformis TaxID=36881 RepID=A0AAE0C596_9CHLO|nr:hypothetical protein CYMTET_42932 [Cymbomonas tetramitiformis]|eukprot:gene17392-20698_t
MRRIMSAFTGPPERPEAAYLYDPKDTIRNILTWSGTSVKMVFFQPDFWFCLIIHIVLTIYSHNIVNVNWDEEDMIPKNPTTWPRVKDGTMLATGAILIFFMVFFNGQAYSRFFSQYFTVRKINYNVEDLFFLTRTHIESPIKQLALVRRLHAAQYLGFAYMPQNVELPGFIKAMYSHLEKVHLLTRAEASDLYNCGDTVNVHEECLLWLIQTLKQEMADGNMKPPIYRAFEGKTLTVINQFIELKAYALQPIPFAYYHLMTVICTLYLFVLAYTSVFVTAYYSIFGYAGTLIALLGLRTAAACLSDPMGTDHCDIPVFDFLAEQHYKNITALTRRPHNHYDLDPPLFFGSDASLRHLVAHKLEPGNFSDPKQPWGAPPETSTMVCEKAMFWESLRKGELTEEACAELCEIYEKELQAIGVEDEDTAQRNDEDTSKSQGFEPFDEQIGEMDVELELPPEGQPPRGSDSDAPLDHELVFELAVP